MLTHYNIAVIGILIVGASLTAGCKRQEIVYYEVPKENDPGGQQATPSFDISQSAMADSSRLNTTDEDIANPDWMVPEGWEPDIPSVMRRGSYRVTGPENLSVEISITAFPGEVGGDLMNINRWRRQIGLSPIAADEVENQMYLHRINDLAYRIVDFIAEKPLPEKSNPQRTIVAILSHGGNSWFFKMTGDATLVAIQEDAYMKFLDSIIF